jgi:hypothetical protein
MNALYLLRWAGPAGAALWLLLAAAVVGLVGCDAANQPVAGCARACMQGGGRMVAFGKQPLGMVAGIPTDLLDACVCEYPEVRP